MNLLCLIGNLISFLEKLLRSIFGKSSRSLLVGGAVLVILVLAFSFCVPFLVLALAEKINPWLAFAVESFMCFSWRKAILSGFLVFFSFHLMLI